MWLWVYLKRIRIYPIFYLLKGDCRFRVDLPTLLALAIVVDLLIRRFGARVALLAFFTCYASLSLQPFNPKPWMSLGFSV